MALLRQRIELLYAYHQRKRTHADVEEFLTELTRALAYVITRAAFVGGCTLTFGSEKSCGTTTTPFLSDLFIYVLFTFTACRSIRVERCSREQQHTAFRVITGWMNRVSLYTTFLSFCISTRIRRVDILRAVNIPQLARLHRADMSISRNTNVALLFSLDLQSSHTSK